MLPDLGSQNGHLNEKMVVLFFVSFSTFFSKNCVGIVVSLGHQIDPKYRKILTKMGGRWFRLCRFNFRIFQTLRNPPETLESAEFPKLFGSSGSSGSFGSSGGSGNSGSSGNSGISEAGTRRYGPPWRLRNLRKLRNLRDFQNFRNFRKLRKLR